MDMFNIWMPIKDYKYGSITSVPLGVSDYDYLKGKIDESVVRVRIESGLIPTNDSKTAHNGKESPKADIFILNPYFVNKYKIDDINNDTPFVISNEFNFGKALIFNSFENFHTAVNLPGEYSMLALFNALECYLRLRCIKDPNIIDDSIENFIIKPNNNDINKYLPNLIKKAIYEFENNIIKEKMIKSSYLISIDAYNIIKEIENLNNYELKNYDEVYFVYDQFIRDSLELRCAAVVITNKMFYISIFIISILIILLYNRKNNKKLKQI